MNPPTTYLSTAEVAARLDVTVATVSRWVQAGRLVPAIQLPGRTGSRAFTIDAIDAFAAERAAPTAAP